MVLSSVLFCFSGHGASLELLRFLYVYFGLVPLVNFLLESRQACTRSFVPQILSGPDLCWALGM